MDGLKERNGLFCTYNKTFTFRCNCFYLASQLTLIILQINPALYYNAVIMGRKTWDSIPPRFRPLKERRNIVITRGSSGLRKQDILNVTNSFESALLVAAQFPAECKAFVIGGSQIYKAALERLETKRILLTRILDDFECDTVFPVELRKDGEAEGWVRKTKEELDRWVGETVPEGVQEENGTRYTFEMWERIDWLP